MKIPKTVIKALLPRRARASLRTAICNALELEPADRPRPLIPHLIRAYCQGQGLEIGPGKYPYCDRRSALYLDRFTDNKDATPAPDIVSDAARVPVGDATFDFLVSSHTLEHHQNTLKTLYEWVRVVKTGGILFLVLPHAERMFDRHRRRTTLQHHIDDFLTLTEEYDRSHDAEIIEGWSKNPGPLEERKRKFEQQWGFGWADFEARAKNAVIHYHVWTQNEMIDVLKYVGVEIVYVADRAPERDDSFVIIARKGASA